MLRLGLGEKPTSKSQMMCWSAEVGDRVSGDFRDNSGRAGFGALRRPPWGPANPLAWNAIPEKPRAHRAPVSRPMVRPAAGVRDTERRAVNGVSGAAFVPGSLAEGARTSKEHRGNMKTAPPLRRRTQGAGVGARRHRLCVPEFSFNLLPGNPEHLEALGQWRRVSTGWQCGPPSLSVASLSRPLGAGAGCAPGQERGGSCLHLTDPCTALGTGPPSSPRGRLPVCGGFGVLIRWAGNTLIKS